MVEMKNTIEIKLNTIEEAIADIRAGKVIIVVDDEDRENEGDFICAAECVTPEIINFMATNGRGLICSPTTEQRAKELKLDRMVAQNTDRHGTAFTVSIDYKHKACTTGISAYDRATGIRALTDASTKAEDFSRPGHIFPLIAKDGGVLRRTGHTEAAIDLATLAGFQPAGVLVEILNEDGTMARLPQLMLIAQKFDLKIVSIHDLVAYRMKSERLVKRVLSVNIPTPYGEFEVIAFKETTTNTTHLVFKKGDWALDEAVLTRVHSGTNAAEIYAAFLKNLAPAKDKTLQKIADEGKGVLLLLRYPEEENALLNILHALKEQQQKGEKLNPFLKRNSSLRQREIGIGAQILHDLGIRKIRLLTNNPRPRTDVSAYDLEIVEQVGI